MTSGLFSYSASLGSTVVTCLAFLLCFYGSLYLTVTCSWCPTFCFRFQRFLEQQWLHVMSVYRGVGISRIFCVKVDLGSLSGGRFRLAGFACYGAPRAMFSFGCAMRVPFAGQVALVRRCATTGAGSSSDTAPRCPWRLHRRISWTRSWALRQVLWSRQCKLSGGAAVAAHLQGH